MFTEKEIAYLNSQPLARLATVAADNQPDVSAVGFKFDGGRFIIGGHKLANSRKHKNVAGGQAKIALIIDDLKTVDPWQPRGIRIYGAAAAVQMEGQFGPGDYLIITPHISWSWSVEGPAFVDGRFVPHRTVHEDVAA
jgi:pyridoxamine 5'-phosphate oxidase family protein